MLLKSVATTLCHSTDPCFKNTASRFNISSVIPHFPKTSYDLVNKGFSTGQWHESYDVSAHCSANYNNKTDQWEAILRGQKLVHDSGKMIYLTSTAKIYHETKNKLAGKTVKT